MFSFGFSSVLIFLGSEIRTHGLQGDIATDMTKKHATDSNHQWPVIRAFSRPKALEEFVILFSLTTDNLTYIWTSRTSLSDRCTALM